MKSKIQGSKIVEVVANNQKALKLLKKQKDFSSLGFFYKFFETDKNKENIKLRHLTRPMSAQFNIKEKENFSFFKNDIKFLSIDLFPANLSILQTQRT